jgi:mRNA-degrading endonuclease RelE of RelBE toxin-antitoxin system
MYYLKIEPDLEKTLKKLAKKNKKQLEIILSKAEEIVENPHRYKNLRAPLNMWKRVHIGELPPYE